MAHSLVGEADRQASSAGIGEMGFSNVGSVWGNQEGRAKSGRK